MRPRRGLVIVLGFVFTVLAVAGCEVSSDIAVNPDGSGRYSITLLVENGPEGAGDKLFDAVKAAAAKSDVPLPVERVSKGSSGGAAISFEFRSLADLEAETQRLAKAGSSLGGVEIERTSTGWHFTASTANGLVRDPKSTETGSPGGAIDVSQLGQVIQLSVAVELPGAPAANNATAVTHGEASSTFMWALTVGRDASALDATTSFVADQASVPLATELTPVSARAGAGDDDDSGGGGATGPLVVILAGAGAAAAVAATATVLVVRRRRRLPAVS